MIDDDGYRPNVGIVICNRQGQVLWARRYGQHSWQFPQGGINPGESPEQAMYRELFEEVGLSRKDVKILASTRNWLRYKLPKRLVRWDTKPVCIGQKTTRTLMFSRAKRQSLMVGVGLAIGILFVKSSLLSEMYIVA